MNEIVANRQTGMFIFEVSGSNPNGCPDQDNSPRRMEDGRGWVSSVSMKRKIRDLLADHDNPAFTQLVNDLSFSDPNRFFIIESMLKGCKVSLASEAASLVSKLAKENPSGLINKYWDVRVFGTTFLREKDKDSSFIRTGPVTINNAISLHPIRVTEATISKKHPLDNKLIDKEQGTLAPMAVKFVNYGLYCAYIDVCPSVAKHTQTTEEDIEVLKYTFKYIFSNTPSVTRPVGSINVVHAWFAKHSNALGSFNARKFLKVMTPTLNDVEVIIPNSIEDYNIPNPDEDEKVKASLEEIGVVDVVDVANAYSFA